MQWHVQGSGHGIAGSTLGAARWSARARGQQLRRKRLDWIIWMQLLRGRRWDAQHFKHGLSMLSMLS